MYSPVFCSIWLAEHFLEGHTESAHTCVPAKLGLSLRGRSYATMLSYPYLLKRHRFMTQPSLTRFAWLSIAAALITLSLKMVAYKLTGSVGLLSDALESLVNLAAAIMALAMLHVASLPPDDDHAYGHSKAEYFSSALEGLLILVAAAGIAWTAFPRLFDPKPIDQVGWGMVVSVGASLVNLMVSRVLFRAGKQYHSITLEADAHHLMTDVWTSAGVLVAVALVYFTGWFILDPIIALLVAANIVWMGIHLMYRSVTGLMDTALPPEELAIIRKALDSYRDQGARYSELRTRQSGASKFISVHVQVPGDWTVQTGHQLLDALEADIANALPNTHILTHLEPI